jgi:hypothetical protein
MRRPTRRAPGRSSACRGCSGRTQRPRGVSGLRSRCRRPKNPTQLVHSFASTLDAARAGDVVVLCGDASSEELEDEVRTVGGTRRDPRGIQRVRLWCHDAVPEQVGVSFGRVCARVLLAQLPEAVMISALEGCDALLEEMYRSIASGWTRMEVLIPRAEYAAASRLYGLRHRSLGFVETLGCARVLPQKVLRLYPLPSRELSAGATMYEDLEVLPLERRDPSRPYVIVNMVSYLDGTRPLQREGLRA